MKPLITESQKREIGALAVEHSDALIAMGSDLYRQGLIKGAIVGGLSVTAGYVISAIRDVRKTIKEQEQNH